MRKIFRLLIVFAVAAPVALLLGAISLPVLYKLRLLGIVKDVPAGVTKDSRYAFCVFSDNGGSAPELSAVARVAGADVAHGSVRTDDATYGQDPISGVQVACYDLLDFVAHKDGPLSLELNQVLPPGFHLGIYSGLWKIPVVVLSVFTISLFLSDQITKFVLSRYASRSTEA